MTPEQIKELDAGFQLVYITLPEKHQKEVQDARLNLQRMRAKCDHKRGEISAIVDGACKICNSQIMSHIPSTFKLRMSDD
jgi:hypothetical protein